MEWILRRIRPASKPYTYCSGIGIARHDLFSIFAVDPTLDGIGCIFKAAYFIKYLFTNEILIF